jgi:hypothetical protein
MYRAFIDERTSPSWPTRRAEMRAWIGELGATRKLVPVGA